MRTLEITITARRTVEEIEVRISRNTDRPQPIGVNELDTAPMKARTARYLRETERAVAEGLAALN